MKRIRRFLVTEKGEVVGIINQNDLLKGTVDAFRWLACARTLYNNNVVKYVGISINGIERMMHIGHYVHNSMHNDFRPNLPPRDYYEGFLNIKRYSCTLFTMKVVG